MVHIGVLKERSARKFTVLSPSGVERLKGKATVLVERGAGIRAGYTDQAYTEAGAQVVASAEQVVEEATIILSYDHPRMDGAPVAGKTYVGVFNFLWDPARANDYSDRGISVHSLDLIPRSTLAQSMDVLSSVASIAGYQAALLAAERLPSVVPMITSAGGTLRPAVFLIMGAGVSGLQAIATARRLGGVVKAYDVRTAAKQEVRSLGASFIEVEGAVDDKAAGGYATEQQEEFLERVRQRMIEEAALADVIITTAKIPGKKAPLLVTREMVENMKPGSVVVDLAATTGGNCELTRMDEVVEHGGVTIHGPSSIESDCAQSTSFVLSNNYTSFLNHLLKHEGDPKEDPILGATLVVEDGVLVNERISLLESATQ